MIRARTTLLALVLALSASLQAQVSLLQWKSHTAVHETQDLCASGEWVWAATTGGLRGLSRVTEEQRIVTNTEGLASNTVLSVAPDGEGGVWVGMDDGWIQRYTPETDHWQVITDFETHAIQALLQTGDTLWVGLDIGVSLYRLEKDEVKETYRRLGDLPVEIPVVDIAILGSDLWVATDQGAAMASLNAANLLDPASWTAYTAANGLLDSDVRALAVQDETLYAATGGGVCAFENGAWSATYVGSAYDVLPFQGTWVVSTAQGVYVQVDQTWNRWDGSRTFASLTADEDGALYGGNTVGLYVFDPSLSDWQLVDNPSLGGNLVSGFALDGEGRLWCTTRDCGLSVYLSSQDRWINYQSATLSTKDWTAIATDAKGQIWAGSWGKGLVCIGQDSSFTFYRADNSPLTGISEDPNYAVITDLYLDSRGTLWVLNYRADDGNALVAIDSSGQWTRFGTADGLYSTLVRAVTEDIYGRKWIGTEEGLYMLDDRGTPSDKSDDPTMSFYGTDQGLVNLDVRAVAASPDGLVYVGTAGGLNSVLDTQISTEYSLPSKSVLSLLVDGAGNLWVGTREGLAQRKKTSLAWTLYGTEDGLTQTDINALAMDYDQGILYIGTNGGLSVLKTPYASPSKKMTRLTAYPNPFRPAIDENVAIDGLGDEVSVAVFTTSGFRVRNIEETLVEGRRLTWDGRDDNGQPVPSGIYVVVAKNLEGQRQIGKLTLIR